MRALILVAGAALTVSACGGREAEEANSVDTLAVNNLVVDENTLGGATTDLNVAVNGTGELDSNTANAVAEDLTTNSPDANLANGM